MQNKKQLKNYHKDKLKQFNADKYLYFTYSGTNKHLKKLLCNAQNA